MHATGVNNEIFEGSFKAHAEKLATTIARDCHKDDSFFVAQAAQWKAGLQPLTRGPAARWAYGYNLIVDCGGYEGPGWSEVANAVFTVIGLTQDTPNE